MTSRIAVEGTAVNAFLPFKFVAILSMKASRGNKIAPGKFQGVSG